MSAYVVNAAMALTWSSAVRNSYCSKAKKTLNSNHTQVISNTFGVLYIFTYQRWYFISNKYAACSMVAKRKFSEVVPVSRATEGTGGHVVY